MFPVKPISDRGSKNEFLHNLDEAREARRREKQAQQAAILIQKNVRGFLVRKKYRDGRKNELNQMFLGFTDSNPQKYPSLPLASTMFVQLQHFLAYYHRIKTKKTIDNPSILVDLQRLLLGVLNYVSTSLLADDIKYSHLAAFFNKELNAQWMKVNQDLLVLALKILETTEATSSDDIRLLTTSLNYLHLMTDCQSWRAIQKNMNELLLKTMLAVNRSYLIHLGQHNLLKILKTVMTRSIQRRLESSFVPNVATLAFKLLINSDFNRTYLILFSQTLWTIPAFVTLCHDCSHKTFQIVCQKDLFNRLLCLYSVKESFVSMSDNIDAVEFCYILGNLVALASTDLSQVEAMKQPFINSLFNILDTCRQRQNADEHDGKQAAKMTSVWHPIIGHVRGRTGGMAISNNELVQRVIVQLKFLWSKAFVNMLFESIPSTSCAAGQSSGAAKKETNIIRAKFEKLFSTKPSADKLSSDELTRSICRIATFYQQLIQILTELRLQILCALSLQDSLITSLWQFLQNIGPTCGLKELLKVYETNKENHPIFDLLQLFCNLCSYLITVLDEEELYRQQKYLDLDSWSTLALFLNQFVYRLIRIEFERSASSGTLKLERNPLFKTFHQLLILLYERNSRKSFTPNAHWLIRDVKSSSSFLADLERDDPCISFLVNQMPHILTFKDRVKILQMFIERDKEKECVDVSSLRHHLKSHIEIHRTNLFGDAFEALRAAPSIVWKNTLRVSFINQQGLAEAGIDQNGIFKEFIQEVTRQAFDPSFNLFKTAENGTLYPSPLSVLNENYLALFNFVGKALSKAVYEQVVLDVELAPFFLRNLLGRKNANYSCLDDLMFLDKDLYNNLNFIKHYDGDVSTLALTYSIDEEVLGEMVTHDIIPCGRHINVTNDDKIVYIHRMSLYRTYTRIKNQIKMFADGFKTLMKPEWINMFSVPELQQLISGESSDVNIEDLKTNVVYQGGYHRTHSVIKWLWQTLEEEFSREERALFLRFVTSSSRAPLLGFRSLNPPFTIRCLESSEQEEEGDSLGRIFRNMINVNRMSSERLPTSSTCFNLLKLPNYKTRRILVEKLRYAIRANAGFELS